MSYTQAYLAIGLTLGLWFLYKVARDEIISEHTNKKYIDMPIAWLTYILLVPLLWLPAILLDKLIDMIEYDRKQVRKKDE